MKLRVVIAGICFGAFIALCGHFGPIWYAEDHPTTSTADCDIHDAVVTQLTAERDGWALRWHNTQQALDECESRIMYGRGKP